MSLIARTSTVTGATLGSRVLGFARDAGTAAVLGAGPLADALMAALALPQLARRLLAEGALNAALIPGLARAGEGADAPEGGRAPRAVATGALVLLVAVLLALAVLGALFMPVVIAILAPGFGLDGERAELAVQCGRVAVFYLPLAGAAAVYGAVANARHRVLLPALAPIAANVVVLCVIVALVLDGRMATATAARAMAAATLAAGLAQLGLMVLAAWGSGAMPRPGRVDWTRARAVLRASVPALLFAGLPQIRLLIVAAVVSDVPGAVSALNYAQRLVDLPLGLVGASAGAVLVPLLAAGGGAIDGRPGRDASRALLAAFGLALPAALGLAVLSHSIVALLYQHGQFDAEDTRQTAWLLAALALALPAQGLEKVLCATALTHGMARPLERIGLVSLLNGTVLAVGFGVGLGPVVGALAIALSASVSALTMAVVLVGARRLQFDRQVGGRMLRLLLAAGLMAGMVGGLALVWPEPPAATLAAAARLAVLVAAGVAVYGGAVLAFARPRRAPADQGT